MDCCLISKCTDKPVFFCKICTEKYNISSYFCKSHQEIHKESTGHALEKFPNLDLDLELQKGEIIKQLVSKTSKIITEIENIVIVVIKDIQKITRESLPDPLGTLNYSPILNKSIEKFQNIYKILFENPLDPEIKKKEIQNFLGQIEESKEPHPPLIQNHQKTKLPKKNIEIKTHFITTPGQDLFIVGSTTELGSWNPSQAKPLNWTHGNVWKISLELSDFPVEYKYILKITKGIEWENGNNHALNYNDPDRTDNTHFDDYSKKYETQPKGLSGLDCLIT